MQNPPVLTDQLHMYIQKTTQAFNWVRCGDSSRPHVFHPPLADVQDRGVQNFVFALEVTVDG